MVDTILSPMLFMGWSSGGVFDRSNGCNMTRKYWRSATMVLGLKLSLLTSFKAFLYELVLLK